MHSLCGCTSHPGSPKPISRARLPIPVPDSGPYWPEGGYKKMQTGSKICSRSATQHTTINWTLLVMATDP